VGKVVKLNEFRKRKAKAEREKQAATNRRLHGRTKAERAQDDLQKKRLTHIVDGARLEAPPKTADAGDASNDSEETEAD
jgi:Domain of unknown function (DUF4169)